MITSPTMNNISSLIIFYLGCYGITILLVQSKILKPIREFFNGKIQKLYQMLNCMMCTSFWVGLLSILIMEYSPTLVFMHQGNELFTIINDMTKFQFVYHIIFDCASVVGVTWLLHSLQLYLENKSGVEL